MSSLKTNGDYLAHEFARLLQSSRLKADIKKKASFDDEHGLEDSDETASEVLQEYDFGEFLSSKDETEGEDDFYDEIDDIILDSPDSDSYNIVSDSLDSEISDFDHYEDGEGLSDKNARILHGLGKIASNLRAKNEGFAADVVEATALSITSDIKKEAAKNNFVKSELKKIASDLSRKGDVFASDLVLATINKI